MSKKQKSSQNLKQQESIRSGQHLNEQWLRGKYIDEGLSTYAIADIVKRDPKNVYNQLRKFGIPTRSRAETLQKNAWWRDGRPSSRIGGKHSDETKEKIRQRAIGRPGLVGEANPMFGKRGCEAPNWKGGSTTERQKLYGTDEWKSLVKYIYARDGYTCKRCGCTQKRTNILHAHHIKSWSENPKLRKLPENLITLCRNCHHWVHSKKNEHSEFIA